MKKIILLIFIFGNSIAWSQCHFQDLLNFNLDEFRGMTPENCLDADNPFLTDKSEVCNCAKDNLKKIQYKADPIDKKKYALKAWERAQIGFFNLSEEIFLLDNDLNTNDSLEPISAPKCSTKDHLEFNGKDSILTCAGKKPILPLSRRKEMGKQLRNSLKREFEEKIKYPNAHRGEGKAFTDRNKMKNKCGSESIPDKLIADVDRVSMGTQINYVSVLITKYPNLVAGKKSLNEAIDSLLKSDSMSEAVQTRVDEIRKNLKANPLMNHVVNSEELFDSLKANNFKPAFVSQAVLDYPKNKVSRQQMGKDIEEKCTAIYQAMEDAICMQASDKIYPEDHTSAQYVITNDDKFYNGKSFDPNNTAHLMQASAILNQGFCKQPEGEGAYAGIAKLIDKNVNDRLKGRDSFASAVEQQYKESVLDKANLLCKHMPPGMEKLEKALKDNNCPKQSNLNAMYDQKCTMLRAAYEVLEPTYTSKKEAIIAEAKAEAKKRGISDKSKIVEIAKEMLGRLDTTELMKAYSEYNNTEAQNLIAGGKAASSSGKASVALTGTSKLMADFLGYEAPTQSNPTLAQNAGTSSQSASTGTSLRGASMDSGASPSERQALSPAQRLAQAKTPRERAQIRTEQNLNDFYKEVADRITRFQNTPAAQAGTSSIADYMRPSPYPASDNNGYDEGYSDYAGSGQESAVGTTIVNNYGAAEDKSAKPSFSAPAQSEAESAEVIAARERNRALGSMEVAQKMRAGRVSGPTDKPSPVKISGVGGSDGRSGRATGSFLAGGAPVMQLESGSLDEDLEKLVSNLENAVQNGFKYSDNIEEAQNLKKLLERKSFILTSKKNPAHKAQIIREGNRFRVIATENELTPGYKNFLKRVRRSVNLENKFKKLLTRINVIIETGKPHKEASARSGLYDRFRGSIDTGSMQ